MSQAPRKKSIRRIKEGVVCADKMDKTVVVAVTRYATHPKYLKKYKITKKYKAHDERGEYKEGDKVVIEESRPLSREKRWRVIKKVTSNQ